MTTETLLAWRLDGPALARRETQLALTEALAPHAGRATAATILAELLANALRHAGAAWLDLRLCRRGQALLLLLDQDRPLPPAALGAVARARRGWRPPPEAPAGRGLVLVAATARHLRIGSRSARLLIWLAPAREECPPC